VVEGDDMVFGELEAVEIKGLRDWRSDVETESI
jgi:hypothetical protein